MCIRDSRTAPPHTTPTPPLRGGAVFDRGPCPSQDPGPPPLPCPDPSGSCHPEGDPDLTPDGPGDSRSTDPGCPPCQGPTGRRTRGRDRTRSWTSSAAGWQPRPPPRNLSLIHISEPTRPY